MRTVFDLILELTQKGFELQFDTTPENEVFEITVYQDGEAIDGRVIFGQQDLESALDEFVREWSNNADGEQP